MRGWKPDLDVHIEATDVLTPAYAAERFGAARTALPTLHREIMQFCMVRDQLESSACVGFSTKGAIYARLKSLGFDPEPFSPLAGYAVGRQLEGIYKGKPLPDEGSYPFLVMRGYREYGIVAESAWRFDPKDYKKKVQLEIPFDIFQKASQFRLSNFTRITAKGQARVDACKRAIASMHPVPLGMMVGSEFQKYRKGLGPVGVETGDDVGGHMTFLCGYEDDGEVFIGCNSWGKDYGDEGFYRIHRSKLEHESTTDLYDLLITDQRAE